MVLEKKVKNQHRLYLIMNTQIIEMVQDNTISTCSGYNYDFLQSIKKKKQLNWI